jgi:beta-glucosidase
LNAAVNDRLSAYADEQHIFFLDLSRHFLDDGGYLAQSLMPDYLHPNERGYHVWADGMEDTIRKLLGK